MCERERKGRSGEREREEYGGHNFIHTNLSIMATACMPTINAALSNSLPYVRALSLEVKTFQKAFQFTFKPGTLNAYFNHF